MSVRAQVLLVIAYLLLVAIVSLAVPLAVNVHDRVNGELRDQASARAALIASAAADHDEAGERVDLQALADAGSRQADGRVVIVDAQGRLLADSARSAAVGTSFTGRAEIARALTGRRVQLQRHSATLGADLLATAVPIVHHGRADGAVRVTQTLSAVNRAINRSTTGIVALAGIVLALGLVAAVVLSGRLARPARRLEHAAEAVAAGRLGTRVDPTGPRELQHLATAFNRMTAQVQDTLEAQQRFVADASHQLRTPLTGTRLHLERVLGSADLDDARDGARVALAEVDRLARTVDELLVLSGDEAPARAAQPLDLADLAVESAARWEVAAEAAGQRVVVDAQRGGTVRAVPDDAERALDALVENAIAYGGPGTTVRLEAGPRSIRVLDEGPGLTAADAELAFERFARGSAGTRAPGSGLGLAISRRLARRNGGEVTLVSREDGPGAVAELCLPEEPDAR